MTNPQKPPEHAKSSDQLKDAGHKSNERLEKPPDVNAVRNATGLDKQIVLEANTNNWHSEQGLFAITDGGVSIAKQKSGQVLDSLGSDEKNEHLQKGTDAAKAIAGPITTEVIVPLADYKSLGKPLPRFVAVKLGPEDNAAIEKRFEEHLAGRKESPISDSDKQKLQNLAICDVFIDKYQEELSRLELREAKNGWVLAGWALEDGAVLGTAKAMLQKGIDEGALDETAKGAAGAVAFTKAVVMLAANANPYARAAGFALQGTAITVAAAEIGQIGQESVAGLMSSLPALQKIAAEPTEANLAQAKETVEKELGPPLADAALFALGFAVVHGVNKAIPGGGKAGRNLEEQTKRIEQKNREYSESLEKPDQPKKPGWSEFFIAFETQVLEAKAALPNRVRRLMNEHKIEIFPVSELERSAFRGEVDAIDKPGGFDGSRIFIAGKWRDAKTNDEFFNQKPGGTVRHEVAHFLDTVLGAEGKRFTQSDEFQAAWKQDLSHLSKMRPGSVEEQVAVKYRDWGSKGQRELFANLLADRMGESSFPQWHEATVRAFPRIWSLVQKIQLED